MSRNTQTVYSNHSSLPTSSQSVTSGQPSSRPPSELLCDLHVYKVPQELWRDAFNNILNNAVTETISVGIIRVPTEIRLVDIREEILQQLEVQREEVLPRDYVFLRSVGRSLTTLRAKQEYTLKAKHFIPPIAYAPELFILEATPELREALAASDLSSQSPPLSRQTSPRNYTYRLGHPETGRTNKPSQHPQSPSNKHKPLPHIGRDPYRSRDPYKRSSNRDPSSSPDPQYNHHKSHNYPNNKYSDPYNPFHNKKDKNSPKQSKPFQQEPESEWDEQPENKQETRDRTPSPNKESPRRSPGRDRNRKHDDDSGVAGLSPEDEQNKHNSEEYNNMLRRTRDMQRRLDADRFIFDDETEEERRRRLEDLEDMDMLDRERWEADQEERKRQAKEDRRKEAEKKKRDEEEKKKLEDEERRNREEEEDRKRKEEKKRRKEQRKREEEEQRKQEEEEKKRKEEEEKKKKAEEEKRRRDVEKKEQEESDRKRKEEENKLKKEVEERRRKEEEKRQKEELERQKEDERLRKLRENRNEFPSPPLQHASPPEHVIRDTESAKQRRRNEKNQLLKDIEEARQARQEQEKIREDLVRKAKQMQHKTTNRRNEARDMWKKKYFEEKKKTMPLEENSNRLQGELEALHKRLMNTLEGPKEKHIKLADGRPSERNNYIIQSTKLQHEIEDLQRRVENARMKLTAEMKLRVQAQTDLKAARSEVTQNRLALHAAREQRQNLDLRNQAQGELRALRAELMQKKQSIEQNRQQQLAALMSPMRNDNENNLSPQNTAMKPAYSSTSLDRF